MNKSVDKNKKYLREYKREFDMAINNNEKIVKKMIDDIQISFNLKMSEIAKMQQVGEKNIVNVENLNRAAENI